MTVCVCWKWELSLSFAEKWLIENYSEIRHRFAGKNNNLSSCIDLYLPVPRACKKLGCTFIPIWYMASHQTNVSIIMWLFGHHSPIEQRTNYFCPRVFFDIRGASLFILWDPRVASRSIIFVAHQNSWEPHQRFVYSVTPKCSNEWSAFERFILFQLHFYYQQSLKCFCCIIPNRHVNAQRRSIQVCVIILFQPWTWKNAKVMRPTPWHLHTNIAFNKKNKTNTCDKR